MCKSGKFIVVPEISKSEDADKSTLKQEAINELRDAEKSGLKQATLFLLLSC